MKQSKYAGKKIPFYKKKQFLTYLIGIFIISIMVFSLISMGDNSGENIEYNNLKFTETTQGFLAYDDDGKPILILSNPEELKELETDNIKINSLKRLSKIYISINPYDNYQNALYDFNNIELFPPQVTSCYEDNDLCAELPLKTCEDATESIGVIIFKQDNETVLSLDDNCLTIQGKDLLKITDKLILDQYGQ